MAEILSPTGKLDVSAVGQLHSDLIARAGQNVTVSLDTVTHLGALSAQALIAAARSARATGHRLKLIDTSDRVLGQLAAMGMTPETIMEGSQ